MGTLPQVLEIIFEMQRKMNNEKRIRTKIIRIFQLTKHVFFFFKPLLLSNLIAFLFLI